MRFSTLAETPQYRQNTDVFGGYNHNLKIADGEWYDMKNMSGSAYPLLSPRGKRGLLDLPMQNPKINGILSKDSLCYVDRTDLYVDGKKVEGVELDDSPKQMVSFGAYLVIFPDKVYVNTKDLSDYGSCDSYYESTGTVTFRMCRVDGTTYDISYISDIEPEAEDGEYWIDTSKDPNVLKQFSKTASMWTSIPTSYVRIGAKDIAKGLNKQDGVKLMNIDPDSGLGDLNGKISVVYDLNRDEEHDGYGDYIVIAGFLSNVFSQTKILRTEKKMPVMDFVCESGNRLWGCRYGLNDEGKMVNEIYASRLGDFRSWNTYIGVSTDSYTASCGTDGAFTGAVSHLGYPIFFKETCMHKVYGNYPANFQIQTTECRGVMSGCGLSIATVNESLIYKSRNGVCMYDGSLPREISSVFGDIHYTGTEGNDPLRCGAKAGCVGNRYYISMRSEVDAKWYMFCYDVSTGMWHKEDETRADAFTCYEGELYYIDHADRRIHTINGTGIRDEAPVEWYAESGTMGTDQPDRKYISSMIIRMMLAPGSRVIVRIQYDSDGDWEHAASITGTTLRTFSFPIRPRRCDHFKIMMVGIGEAKIYSITKIVENGSCR